jgi:ankyrin repeat protein
MDGQDGQDFVIVDRKDIEHFEGEEIVPQSLEDIAKIKQWLQPTDYLSDGSEYKKHLTAYLKGTGNWIQQTEAYQKWHDSPDHGALWTKAIAGAGKSVFAAMIAAHLAAKKKVPVLFFFFRQIVATNHHPKSLVVDFIAQLLDHSPRLQDRMKKLVDDRRTVDGLSMTELWAGLTEALLDVRKVYCVVDALDEMDIDQDSFFLELLKLGRLKPSSIKVLMTSRPLPRIEQVLKDPSVLQIRLEQRMVDRDIAVYVDHRLNQHPEFNDELRKAVKDEIGNKSQGSFLYARLMMDELTSHFDHMIPDIKFIQRSLDWLPITLEDMYNGMLLDHSLRSRVPQNLQVTILRWVTHSSRPLRLLELATMLDSLNDEKKGKDTKAVVRAACGPLLEILEDETVSVIHHSFTEFLIDSGREGRKAPGSVHPQFPVISPPTTHRILAATCLRYLTSGCLSNWEVKPRKEDDDFYSHPVAPQQSIKLQHPFLGYAGSNWYFHITKMGNRIDPTLCEMLDTFMQPSNNDFKAWLDLAWHGTNFLKTSPLHVTARAGLTAYAKHLLLHGADINALDDLQRTPLSLAAARGHTEMAALLLEHGAEADNHNSVCLKPLHYAAKANHHAIAKLLLEKGVSPLTPKTTENSGRRCGNAPTTTGHTPLLYACEFGNVETVREMIPYLTTEQLNSSLCTAAKCGKTQLVELLLTSPDVDVDSMDGGNTPLVLASAGLHFEIMRMLLEKGADPMKRSKNWDTREGFLSVELRRKQDPGPTPFHALCGAPNAARYTRNATDEGVLRKCFKVLKEAGCDINATDNHGKAPLHYSVVEFEHGKSNNVLSKMLLESGADPMARDQEGNTPLHLVRLFKDSASTIEALIAHGADLTAKLPKDCRTPLHCMVENIYNLDLKVLLPHVTNWNVKDSEFDTPLHIILSKSYDPSKVLPDILEAGADLTAKNKKGEVPLHVVRDILTAGDVVPLLLKAGANLEARDNEGRTILMRKLMGVGEHHYIATTPEVFLGYGCKVDTRDNKGNSVLHAVCKKNADPKVIRRLVEAGADPLQVNNNGNTLLHEVAGDYKSQGKEKLSETIRLLLDLGVSPTARDYLGQTVAHVVWASVPPTVLRNTKNPVDIFTAPPFAALINTPDNNGLLPIHLAATISEELVAKLIDVGADLTALTHEERSILHVAARARQSNILGVILDHWSEIKRLNMVDHIDSRGRTALHDACRSGRPESVALLLEAGADPNSKDKKGYTPLHTCAEFEEENKLWASSPQTVKSGDMRAAGVLLSDMSRPESRDSFNQHQRGGAGMWDQISIENDTVRVRDIIRLLVEHGGDVDALTDGSSFAVDLALNNGCEEMANELLPALDKVYAKAAEEERPWGWRGHRQRQPFHEAYVTMRSKHLLGFLGEEMKTDANKKIRRAHELLALREFDAIERLPDMGMDFTPKSMEWPGDFLSVLTKWGYASLLESLGATVKNLWVNGVQNPETEHEYCITPYLLTAVHSRLPNLEVVKVLVEKFGADVNSQQRTKTYRAGGYEWLFGGTALHVLARGVHWWQAEAMEYLLSKGANPELPNEKGLSVLHVAVSSDPSYGTYRQHLRTKLLLQHGADPNSVDSNGLTCLNKAIHDVELVRMLIKHGADINLGSQSILFSAIAAQDLPTIMTILGTGADCNTRQKRLDKPHSTTTAEGIEEHEFYPVHYAASFAFDRPQTRDTAIAIIKILLAHGAIWYMQFRDDACILHSILGNANGGILTPFLEIPDLDLETRDPTGKTLLLAACSSSRGTHSPTTLSTAHFGSTPYETLQNIAAKDDPTAAQTLYEMGANLRAVDLQGNNALHLLVQANPHNEEEYKRTFSLFIEKKPELVNQQNYKGFTPFHLATRKTRTWSAQALIKAGANPLEPDPLGNTALHYLAPLIYTASPEWVPVFKKFLALGIDVSTQNNKGETPLFGYFRTDGRWQVGLPARNNFKLFQEAGADVFMTNMEGEGLLHVVAKRVSIKREDTADVVDAFRFLMEKGLDPALEDGSQRSALVSGLLLLLLLLLLVFLGVFFGLALRR